MIRAGRGRGARGLEPLAGRTGVLERAMEMRALRRRREDFVRGRGIRLGQFGAGEFAKGVDRRNVFFCGNPGLTGRSDVPCL